MKNFLILNIFIFSLLLHSQESPVLIPELLKDSPSIKGKVEYLNSPFVTAGNRLYIVGHQDGSFPELGWHIKKEMGGVWNHPIKLFDGFEAEIHFKNDTVNLNNAFSFTNFPIASKHSFDLEEHSIKVERWQYVSDTSQSMVIQFILNNTSNSTQDFHFYFKIFADLRPTWLGERTGMEDGADEPLFNLNGNYYIFKDGINPWYSAVLGKPAADFHHSVHNKYTGMGTAGSLGYNIKLEPNSTRVLTFYLGGSYSSISECLNNVRQLENNLKNEVLSKKKRYQELADLSKLTIPDKKLQQTFEWLKYNSAWLVQEVPEIGTGITAGIPDYPWWFGVDSEYALKGYMAVGQTEPVLNTIKLLDSVSMAVNGNGKIIHEMSTNGAVFNKGNINETPQFASLIWEIYKWNGDIQFLKKYFPTIKKGLHWLLNENDQNGNLFPDGFGMMEIHGLDSEMIDVAVYTQKAFADASKIADELSEKELNEEYSKVAEELKIKINDKFWSEEFGSYADFIGTDEQALKLIEDAIIRADTLGKPWSANELKLTKQYILKNPSEQPRPFVLHHNWVVNTPMEMKIADKEKAKTALKTAEKYTNPFGVFVTGIDRDETAGTQQNSFKGSEVFSYTGAVMTLPTGVQAIAENNYENPDKALDYLNRMSNSFSYALPGSMYEVSPDYGMMTQAWNIYSFAVPIVQQFFGIQPMASDKTITIKPQFPSKWKDAAIENVQVNNNNISIFYKKRAGKISYEITQSQPDWKLILLLPKMKYEVSGGSIISEEETVTIHSASGKLKAAGDY